MANNMADCPAKILGIQIGLAENYCASAFNLAPLTARGVARYDSPVYGARYGRLVCPMRGISWRDADKPHPAGWLKFLAHPAWVSAGGWKWIEATASDWGRMPVWLLMRQKHR